MLGLLLDGDGIVILVELDHAKALRIIDVIAKDRGALAVLGARNRASELLAKAVAVEDVVTEHERAGLSGAELLADDERLGKAVRRRLHLVGQMDAELAAITQKTLEIGEVGRRGDDENVANARHHERGERIVDHRLVVDRQQLLARDQRERIQARAAAACQYDALHMMRSLGLGIRYR